MRGDRVCSRTAGRRSRGCSALCHRGAPPVPRSVSSPVSRARRFGEVGRAGGDGPVRPLVRTHRLPARTQRSRRGRTRQRPSQPANPDRPFEPPGRRWRSGPQLLQAEAGSPGVAQRLLIPARISRNPSSRSITASTHGIGSGRARRAALAPQARRSPTRKCAEPASMLAWNQWPRRGLCPRHRGDNTSASVLDAARCGRPTRRPHSGCNRLAFSCRNSRRTPPGAAPDAYRRHTRGSAHGPRTPWPTLSGCPVVSRWPKWRRVR